MSLTSYRAAPPRDQGFSLWLKKRPAQEVSNAHSVQTRRTPAKSSAHNFLRIFAFAACQDFISPANFLKTKIEHDKEENEQRSKTGIGWKDLHAADGRRQ
jgi:hypothetical protein